MLKSMTAYGRAAKDTPEGHFVVEIQSLNRRFLDVSVQLPRELNYLEIDVRRWVSSKIFRGKVTLNIAAFYNEQFPLSVVPNIPLARQLKTVAQKLGSELEIQNVEPYLLQMLANEPGVLTYTEENHIETYKKILETIVFEATEKLLEMKKKEGEEIQNDFVKRLEKLKKALKNVSDLKSNSSSRYREKLKKTIEEVLPGSIDNDERILREVTIFADKVDITEEITRFDSHIIQFLDLLESDKKEKGKTLEFLLQEMLREANTIGSKSDDVGITKNVIEMKGEIEKIREQVQNVE